MPTPNNITITYDAATRTFICVCHHDDRAIPKDAGFFWSPISREWQTKKISTAARLLKYFDETARKVIGNTSVDTINWPTLDIRVPKDQRLKRFQEDGARFALTRNHSYLAFDMGLGKTPTAISVINTLRADTLIICPPFLVSNWQRELKTWLINPSIDQISNGTTAQTSKESVIVLPDSLLDRSTIQDFIRQRNFELLIIDEAHRFKSPEAKRTKALFGGITSRIPRVICLSGTPMPNRPIELFSVLSSLAHNSIHFMDKHTYGLKFCNAFETKHGWDYTGASNLDVLSRLIQKDFMMRRSKAEMMPELGPKEERIIPLNGSETKDTKKLNRSLYLKYQGDTDQMIKHRHLGDLSEYRRRNGIDKVPVALEYIKDILDNSSESLLVFAWHREVITLLEKELSKITSCAVIDGGTKPRARDERIRDFQNGDLRLIIGQISTMVGHNLTKATRCIFVESSWSPADNEQAADRAHRIGQTDTVVVDYLVISGTIDDKIVSANKFKKININKVGLGPKGA